MDKALHDVCTAVVDAYAHQRVAEEDRAAHEQVSCARDASFTCPTVDSQPGRALTTPLTALGIHLFGTCTSEACGTPSWWHCYPALCTTRSCRVHICAQNSKRRLTRLSVCV
jgi:hypothetical protein